MDLKEIGTNTRHWVNSAQDTDYWRASVNAALNFPVSQAMELVIRSSFVTLEKWILAGQL